MRIYKTDGTFVDNQKDTEFGWNLDGIVVHQNHSRDKEVNENHSHDKEVNIRSNSKFPLTQLQKEDAFMESVDIVEPEKPIVVKHVKVNIKTEPIVNVVNCKMDIEGPPIKKKKSKRTRDLKNVQITVISKEELSKLINPCNMETKALMSIIYFAKYKSLIKEETSAELFKTVNFKTTNYKYLMKEEQENVKEEILKDIQHYYATNEDNMLSLMMELILADIGCNLEDIIDIDQHITKANTSETSSFGNSIPSSVFNRDWSPFRNNTNAPDRCSILSSIGLDDEDKSLQSLCEETLEMRLQTAEIKESFQVSIP